MAHDPKGIFTARQWAALRPAEKAAYLRTLEAVSLMRQGVSARNAARQAGTTLDTLLRYGAPALRRDARGRTVAKARDRVFRSLAALTTRGLRQVDVTNSQDASTLGGHWSSIGHYLGTGDDNRLRTFKGKRVAGHILETDPDEIERLAWLGQLDFEDIYDLTR